MDSVYDLFPVTQVLAILAIIKTKDKLLSMLMMIDALFLLYISFSIPKILQELRYCLYNPCKITECLWNFEFNNISSFSNDFNKKMFIKDWLFYHCYPVISRNRFYF